MTDFQTVRPTGRPSWPTILLAGIPGSGKTWAAAEATGLPMFGRSLFIEVGESMANEYGQVPGANYEIVVHDGTEQQIRQAVAWAAEQPTVDGKPNLLVIDSVTDVWQVLQDEQQRIANERARRKGRGGNGADATITMDQWNVAKDRMADMMMSIRRFPGPVLLTARLDNVAVVEGGQPTGQYTWRVRAEKNLPYHATVVLQAREPRQWTMTKIASSVLQMPPAGYMPWPDFTVEELLVRMELDQGDVAPNTYVQPVGNTPDAEQGQQQPQQKAPTRAPADALPELPADLPQVLAQHEQDGNLDAVRDLHRLASELANSGVPGARVALARIEGTGKRLAHQQAQQAQQVQADAEQAQQAATEPTGPQAPSEPTEGAQQAYSGQDTPTEGQADNEQALDDARDADEDAQAPEGSDRVDANGTPLPEPDPANTRRDSARRRGLLQALQDTLGAEALDWVYGRCGLEVTECSTDRLSRLVEEAQKQQEG